LTRSVQICLGAGVIVLNLLIYVLVVRAGLKTTKLNTGD